GHAAGHEDVNHALGDALLDGVVVLLGGEVPELQEVAQREAEASDQAGVEELAPAAGPEAGIAAGVAVGHDAHRLAPLVIIVPPGAKAPGKRSFPLSGRTSRSWLPMERFAAGLVLSHLLGLSGPIHSNSTWRVC